MKTSLIRTKKVIRRYGPIGAIKYSLSILPAIMDYYVNPYSAKKPFLHKVDYNKIRYELSSRKIEVAPFTVDTDQFHGWLRKTAFPKSYIDSLEGVFLEKALEYYVGQELLDLRKNDVLIDVAAGQSPWVKMVQRHIGCKAYSLDLAYEAGIHDERIGADATAIPLPDGSVTKMGLHCSYETFEGRSDINFLKEAERVLTPGGKMVILPLYLHNSFFVDSSPWADRRDIDYDGALKVWRNDGHIVRFSRKYSVEAFVRRVLEKRGNLSFSLYYVENEKEISENCYLKFALVFQKDKGLQAVINPNI